MTYKEYLLNQQKNILSKIARIDKKLCKLYKNSNMAEFDFGILSSHSDQHNLSEREEVAMLDGVKESLENIYDVNAQYLIDKN